VVYRPLPSNHLIPFLIQGWWWCLHYRTRLNAAEKSRTADKSRKRLQAAEKFQPRFSRISRLQLRARDV